MEKEGVPYFFSLNFNIAGQSLPPASGDEIVLHDPLLAWGIIALDVWLMNVDRHGGNIAFDKSTGQIQIFDHSHAFSGENGDAIATLHERAKGLALVKHCLAGAINTFDGLDVWCDRISKVPDFFIEGVVDAATGVGLPSDAASAAIQILKDRRGTLKALIVSNLGAFPRLPKGTP